MVREFLCLLVNFLYIFLPNKFYLVEFNCNDLIDCTMVVLQDGNVFLKRVNICKIFTYMK